MKIYKVENKLSGDVHYFKLQKDVCKKIGRGKFVIWDKFKRKGFYENKEWLVKKENVL